MSLCKQFDKLTQLLCRILAVYILTNTGMSALADKHNDAPINITIDNNTPPATLVLILDDMGNHLASGRRALALPGARHGQGDGHPPIDAGTLDARRRRTRLLDRRPARYRPAPLWAGLCPTGGDWRPLASRQARRPAT